MFEIDWKKEVFTIPNILSLFRLLLIPVYVVIYINAKQPHAYFIAGTILAVSCLTDLIDGQIARHFNMISNLGKVLDPFADKATQFALILCLSIKYRSMQPVLFMFLTKEIFQATLAWFRFRQGKVLSGALLAGKICTTVLFLSLILLVLMPNLSERIVNTIALIDFVFLAFAFTQYVFAFLSKHTKMQNYEA